jgi:hypothetical protein
MYHPRINLKVNINGTSLYMVEKRHLNYKMAVIIIIIITTTSTIRIRFVYNINCSEIDRKLRAV